MKPVTAWVIRWDFDDCIKKRKLNINLVPKLFATQEEAEDCGHNKWETLKVCITEVRGK